MIARALVLLGLLPLSLLQSSVSAEPFKRADGMVVERYFQWRTDLRKTVVLCIGGKGNTFAKAKQFVDINLADKGYRLVDGNAGQFEEPQSSFSLLYFKEGRVADLGRCEKRFPQLRTGIDELSSRIRSKHLLGAGEVIGRTWTGLNVYVDLCVSDSQNCAFETFPMIFGLDSNFCHINAVCVDLFAPDVQTPARSTVKAKPKRVNLPFDLIERSLGFRQSSTRS